MAERQAERQGDRQKGTGRQTARQGDRQSSRWVHRQAMRQAYSQAYRQAYGQTDKCKLCTCLPGLTGVMANLRTFFPWDIWTSLKVLGRLSTCKRRELIYGTEGRRPQHRLIVPTERKSPGYYRIDIWLLSSAVQEEHRTVPVRTFPVRNDGTIRLRRR